MREFVNFHNIATASLQQQTGFSQGWTLQVTIQSFMQIRLITQLFPDMFSGFGID